MVSYCCVNGCGNTSKNKNPHSAVSFHVFPANKELRSKWLRAIGRPNWSPSNHTRVCSAHFSYDQINHDSFKIRIKNDAVPVLLLPLNSNFEASNVEACRICLATDVKLYSLQGTLLGTCIKSIAGLSISKDLIIEQNRSQPILKSLDNSFILNDYLLQYDEECNTSPFTSAGATDNDHNHLKSDDDTITDADTHLNNKECQVEANETELFEVNEDVAVEEIKMNSSDDVLANGDLSKDLRSNAQKEEEYERQVIHTKKKPAKKSLKLTPGESNMLKYFDIVQLSINSYMNSYKNGKRVHLVVY